MARKHKYYLVGGTLVVILAILLTLRVVRALPNSLEVGDRVEMWPSGMSVLYYNRKAYSLWEISYANSKVVHTELSVPSTVGIEVGNPDWYNSVCTIDKDIYFGVNVFDKTSQFRGSIFQLVVEDVVRWKEIPAPAEHLVWHFHNRGLIAKGQYLYVNSTGGLLQWSRQTQQWTLVTSITKDAESRIWNRDDSILYDDNGSLSLVSITSPHASSKPVLLPSGYRVFAVTKDHIVLRSSKRLVYHWYRYSIVDGSIVMNKSHCPLNTPWYPSAFTEHHGSYLVVAREGWVPSGSLYFTFINKRFEITGLSQSPIAWVPTDTIERLRVLPK